MAYSGCSSLGGNLDFLDFLQKQFYNINYWYRFLDCLMNAFCRESNRTAITEN